MGRAEKEKFQKGKMKKNIPTFVKWVGGKKQLIEQFKQLLPKKIERYAEPFVGGGAVAFYILKTYKPKEIILSDNNEELINCYKVIRKNVEELIKLLKKYKNEHNKEVYYQVRAEDPKLLSDVSRAARFIYLNKTCFNGLYRVNSKGQFNVPIGDYKNPAICPEKDLREISKFLKNAVIKQLPFEKVLEYAKKGWFIYFDPPYYPLKKGKSFTTYTKEKFLDEEQKHLAAVFKKLDKKSCEVMLSNSDTEFIETLYKGYCINRVKAARMISSVGTGRGKISELVITNY